LPRLFFEGVKEKISSITLSRGRGAPGPVKKKQKPIITLIKKEPLHRKKLFAEDVPGTRKGRRGGKNSGQSETGGQGQKKRRRRKKIDLAGYTRRAPTGEEHLSDTKSAYVSASSRKRGGEKMVGGETPPDKKKRGRRSFRFILVYGGTRKRARHTAKGEKVRKQRGFTLRGK